MNAQIYTAFCAVDRACRGEGRTDARNFLLRHQCLLALGDPEAADRDLLFAAQLDFADPRVQDALLQYAEDPELREMAARELIENPRASRDSQSLGIKYLVGSRRVAVQLTRSTVGCSCTIFTDQKAVVTVRIITEVNVSQTDVTTRMEFVGGKPSWLAEFRFELASQKAARLVILIGDEALETVHLWPISSHMLTHDHTDSQTISVVIPVYSGLDATSACFNAIASQQCSLKLDVVVVNDASPDTALVQYVEEFSARHGWRYVRNRINSGFASSINRGLSQTRGAFVLVLNADAVLPAEAMNRMLNAAKLPDVGTVVPFSNVGGFTSFPRILTDNPLPTATRAKAIDEAARQVNAGIVIDAPSGTAFCMLITGVCLDAIGGFDVIYGRGYFEDVDFCLNARQHGFRNVAAADVFVAHVGGQSFGNEKRALAARNALLINERFPEYGLNSASFVQADPLASVRGAIERALPPAGAHQLIIGRRSRFGPILERRIRERASYVERVIEVWWGRDGNTFFRAADGEAPQSIQFGLHEQDICTAYLEALDIQRIDLFEPDVIPPMLLKALLKTGAQFYIQVADYKAASSVKDGWRPGEVSTAITVQPSDSLAQAFLIGKQPRPSIKDNNKNGEWLLDSRTFNGSSIRIGILMPLASATAERLLQALLFSQPYNAVLIVFGNSLSQHPFDMESRVIVTGPMSADEYPAAARYHGLTHLVLPYRGQLFGLLEELQRVCGLPAAFVDWSAGYFVPNSYDLAIEYAVAEREAAMAVWSWCSSKRCQGCSHQVQGE